MKKRKKKKERKKKKKKDVLTVWHDTGLDSAPLP